MNESLVDSCTEPYKELKRSSVCANFTAIVSTAVVLNPIRN